MDLPEEAKRAPSAPFWNQSFPSPQLCMYIIIIIIIKRDQTTTVRAEMTQNM